MKRRNCNGFGVLDNILESVGVENMVNDSDDESDDDSDSEHMVNWIQRAISDAHAHTEGREISKVRQKNGLNVRGNVARNYLTPPRCSTGIITIPRCKI